MPCSREVAICLGMNSFFGSLFVGGMFSIIFCPETSWSSTFPTHSQMWRHGLAIFFIVLLVIQACVNIFYYSPFLIRLFRGNPPVIREAEPLRRAPWDDGRPPRMVRMHPVNGQALHLT